MGFKKNKKNRYKRKPPVKKESIPIRHRMHILIKTVFVTLLIACMALFFIFIHDFITQSDYFRADTISVEGCELLMENQILDAAKIKEGDNFVSMNLKTIQKRLLAHPWVAKAEIARTPSGAISIRIQEQKPLAVVDFGKRFLINTDGVIFKEATDAEGIGMPVMSGIDYSDWKAAETPGAPFLSSVLEILRAGSTKGGVLPNGSIKHILIDREMGLTLQIEGPVRMVKLGYGDYEVKCSRLRRILSYLATDKHIPFIEEMDLRNPDSVVAKPGIIQDTEKDKKEV
ncbi:MAG: FtsQ-type POTRA domain-containing protein [Desulfosalsimonadaceae bacterium]